MTLLRVALAAASILVAVGCAADETGNGPTAALTTSTTGQTSSTATEEETTDATTELLLAEEFTALAGANGVSPECYEDAAFFLGSEDAGVWLQQGDPRSPLTLPYTVQLCLAGFEAGSVTLDATVGGETFRTTLLLQEERGLSAESPETLFQDDGSLTLTSIEGTYQSDAWDFVPPPSVRDALVTGGINLVASQGSLTVERTQPVEAPTDPYRFWLEHGPPFLLIYGYPAGERVPVGLYRFAGEEETENGLESRFTLVRQIDVVTMPVSRVVLYEVSPSVIDEVAGKEQHCVTVPLSDQFNCPLIP